MQVSDHEPSSKTFWISILGPRLGAASFESFN